MTIENYQKFLVQSSGVFSRMVLTTGQDIIIKSLLSARTAFSFVGMNFDALGVRTPFAVNAKIPTDTETVLYSCASGRSHGVLRAISLDGYSLADIGISLSEGTVGAEVDIDEWEVLIDDTSMSFSPSSVAVHYDFHLLSEQSLWISEQGEADVTWLLMGILIDDTTGDVTGFNTGVVASTSSSSKRKTIYTCPTGKTAIFTLHGLNWGSISPSYKIGATYPYCVGGNYSEGGGGGEM
jgi:hypothetical protein